MNLAQVARILAGFCMFFSLLQSGLLAAAMLETAAADRPISAVAGFAWGTGIGLGSALLLWLCGRRAAPDFFRREGLAAVGIAWVVAGLLGGLPFLFSGALPRFTDALFESVSGLTTTGASVLGTGGNFSIEDLPRSLLFWRALLQWIGGLGVVLVFIVLLPAMGVTGKNLLASEQIGVANESLRPSMRLQARALLRLYIGLTLAFAVYLTVHGAYFAEPGRGNTWFDAICHAFTTLATGGFSTKNMSMGAFDSVAVEVGTIVFMFLAGANFTLLLSSLHHRSARRIWENSEFRLYVYITAVLSTAVALLLWTSAGTIVDPATTDRAYGSDFWRCVRDATFQVVSVLTSTGFATADFQNWPKTALILLMFAMFVGGCTGSTAGGFKIVRVLVSGKLIAFTLRRFIRPKSVEKLKVGDDVVPNGVVSMIMALLVLWLADLMLGTLVLTIEDDLGLLSALSTSMSMTSCTGPAINEVIEVAAGHFEPVHGLNLGPYGGFGGLSVPSKLCMCLQMIFGRLEIFAPLVLLAPGFWRR